MLNRLKPDFSNVLKRERIIQCVLEWLNDEMRSARIICATSGATYIIDPDELGQVGRELLDDLPVDVFRIKASFEIVPLEGAEEAVTTTGQLTVGEQEMLRVVEASNQRLQEMRRQLKAIRAAFEPLLNLPTHDNYAHVHVSDFRVLQDTIEAEGVSDE